MSTIGTRIRERREALNITQEQLAAILGYKSRSSVNKIEVSTRGLPQHKLVAIARALQTTPAFLTGWEDDGCTSDKEPHTPSPDLKGLGMLDTNTFGERFRYLRKQAGLSQQALATTLKVSKSAVSMWEIGKRFPELESFDALCRLFRTTPSFLLGWDAEHTPENPMGTGGAYSKVIPVFSEILSGDETWEEISDFSLEVVSDPFVDFGFIIRGENLTQIGIRDGSVALTQKTSEAEDGAIVLAFCSGGDVNAWRYRRYGDIVVLRPENPEMKEVVCRPEDVRIFGVVRSVRINM